MAFYISLTVNSIYSKRVNVYKILPQLHTGDWVDELYFTLIVKNHAGNFAISFLCF